MQEPPRGASPPPPRAGDVAPYIEDDRPATLGDIKGLRRWLIVTAVWAVAATALGVIALIQANESDEEGRTQSAADLARVQKDLNKRMDSLEARVDGLPSSDDVSKLDGRIRDLENKADRTSSDVGKLNGRVEDLERKVDDLESRVDDLEQASEQQTNTTTTP